MSKDRYNFGKYRKQGKKIKTLLGEGTAQTNKAKKKKGESMFRTGKV